MLGGVLIGRLWGWLVAGMLCVVVALIVSSGRGGLLMAFVITGRVMAVRRSVSDKTGEVSHYVNVADFGQDATVTFRDDLMSGIARGANIQVPVSVRASAYQGAARLTLLALEPARVTPATAAAGR